MLRRRGGTRVGAWPVGLVLAASLALTGCAATGGGEQGSPPPDAAASGSAGSGAYPVTIRNCGRDVTLQSAPQRIVGLNQSSTETLLALGAGDRMVGTSTWFDPVLPQFTQQNAKITRLADNNPSLESVLAVKPDFLAATYTADLPGEGSTTMEDLARLHLPVYMAPAECTKSAGGKGDGERTTKLTLGTIYQEVTDLAALTGDPAAGDRVVADLRKRVAAVSRHRSSRPVTVAFWFANSEAPYVAGGLGSPQIAADALGLTNVYAGSRQEWPQVSWEDFAAKDPDVIVLADLTRKRKSADSGDEKVAFLARNPVTAQMRAVRDKRFVRLHGADLNPSIRTVDSMERLAAGLRDLGLGGDAR